MRNQSKKILICICLLSLVLILSPTVIIRHVLFTNPKVGDIVCLLVENSKNMPKSDEELLEEAKAVVKAAYSEILGLNDATDDTDFFAAGGGEYCTCRIRWTCFEHF